MADIDIESTSDHGTATYVYTDVADGKGIIDAKEYHNYLKENEHCIKIDEFDENKGSYTAYFRLEGTKVNEGFSMKVTFKKDTYTIQISDNVNLDDL